VDELERAEVECGSRDGDPPQAIGRLARERRAEPGEVGDGDPIPDRRQASPPKAKRTRERAARFVERAAAVGDDVGGARPVADAIGGDPEGSPTPGPGEPPSRASSGSTPPSATMVRWTVCGG
jgi:hypothetical protein